jgi:ADP-heptose:LPS heptosyltransferase
MIGRIRMRAIRPSSNTGMIVPTQQTIKTGGQITAYTKPSPSLNHIDRLMKGGKPNLAITRKQGGLGDVLMTLPTVKAISKKYGVQVTYGTDFDYLDGALPAVLEGNPYISKIVKWRDLNPDEFDAVIDLTCPCVAHEVPHAQPINRIDLFARHAQVHLDDTSIDYYIKDSERKWADEYIANSNLGRFVRILVQPSSTSTNRDCPHSKIKDAVQGILQAQRNIRAIVVTHNSDNLKLDWQYSDVHIAHNLRARQIAALMEQCDLVLCPDSAILHIASALHKPTVTLFGPTDPKARVNYHPEAVAVWPAKNLKSYPVWYQDPRDGFLCWKLIDTNLIRDVALAIINHKPLPDSNDLVYYGPYTQLSSSYQVI